MSAMMRGLLARYPPPLDNPAMPMLSIFFGLFLQIGLLWGMLFFTEGQRSLRQLFWLVTYWGVGIGIFISLYRVVNGFSQ